MVTESPRTSPMTPYPDWLSEQERFIKVKAKGKEPLEEWADPEYRYAWDDPALVEHRADGGNVSMVCGGRIVVIDIDEVDRDAIPTWLFKLPSTFTVRTGSGGLHRYYRCWRSQYGTTRAFDWGEVRGGQAVVACPGNVHPNGNQYEVVSDEAMAYIPAGFVEDAIDRDEDPDLPDLEDLEEIDGSNAPPTKTIIRRHPWMQEYPKPGERSEFDFAVAAIMLRYGCSKEQIEEYLKSFEHSKVKERGTIAYGRTWENVRREVGEEAGTWTIESVKQAELDEPEFESVKLYRELENDE